MVVDQYYTAEEAMQKLNKPRSSFFREVENGLIPFELEPGRQKGQALPRASYRCAGETATVKAQKRRPYPSHLYPVKSRRHVDSNPDRHEPLRRR